MFFKSLIGLSYVLASLVSMSANAAVINWEPTDGDVNIIYTADPINAGYQLGIFDVGNFDGNRDDALKLNIVADAFNLIVDTIDITASSATSSVTGRSIALSNNKYVLAITTDGGTSWSEPSFWDESTTGSNMYGIIFDNIGSPPLSILSVDAVPTIVPIPAPVWLFGSGLLGLVGVARRKVIN